MKLQEKLQQLPKKVHFKENNYVLEVIGQKNFARILYSLPLPKFLYLTEEECMNTLTSIIDIENRDENLSPRQRLEYMIDKAFEALEEKRWERWKIVPDDDCGLTIVEE